MFSTMEYTAYEDEGQVNITLLLQKPALESIQVRISATPLTATGEFRNIYADTRYCLVRTLSDTYNLLLLV